MKNILIELKRRNVFRVAIAYAIIGWLLVEVASVLFPTFEAPAWVMKVFATVVILGFPIAIVFAWIFEMTPEGLKREHEVDRSQSITPATGRKLDFVIIGLLTIALIFFVSTHDWGGEGDPGWEEVSTSGIQSIAVLPFVNMSDDPSNEYFSDGISEELLNVLVKVKGLQVASRTSSFSFKDREANISEIAGELNVDHVLEGSVRKSGNTVRITAQLIDVRSDRHLWSESYDRELEDIFAIQDEIARNIVEALKVALGTEEEQAIADAGRPTENLEAYELYLRGRYFWQRRGEANIRQAIGYLNEAIELDPGFARAWSGLAAAYTTLPVYSNEPYDELTPLAVDAARQALELDDALAEAYAVIADASRIAREWSEAEEYYKRAIASEPKDSTSHLWYAEHLAETGRTRESLEQALISYRLDPLNPGTNSNLTFINLQLGDFENTIRHGRAAVDLGHPFGLVGQAQAYLRQGEYDRAIEYFQQFEEALDLQDRFAVDFVEALQDPDKRPGFVEYLTQLGDTVPLQVRVGNFAALDQIDAAYEAAYSQVNVYDGNMWIFLWGQQMPSFRADPRFEDLVTQIGLADFWRTSGKWPDKCQPVDDRIICD